MTTLARAITPRAKVPARGDKHPRVDLQLHSRPGAPRTLSLDFTSIFDLDGDQTTFNDDELSWIKEIWERVSESFSLFAINVTTVRMSPVRNQIHLVVIGGDSRVIAGESAGGLSRPGSFYQQTADQLFDNISRVFTEQLILWDGKDIQVIAQVIAHEAGHSLAGLGHQSLPGEEYNSGNSLVAPIMGWSGDSERGVWYPNEIAALGNILGTLPDVEKSLVDGKASGVINNYGDVDRYEIAGGGLFRGRISTPKGAMLLPRLTLRSMDGEVLANAPGGILEATLSNGNYLAWVQGDGIGQYAVEITSERTLTAPKFLSPPVLLNGQFSIYNPDGRPLTFKATVMPLGTIVKRLYQLEFTGDYVYNFLGKNEIWLKGKTNQFGNQWYYIVPGGGLFAWDGLDNGEQLEQLEHVHWRRPEIVHAGFTIAQALHLVEDGGDFLNHLGLGERWLKGDGNQFGSLWYYVLPTGEFMAAAPGRTATQEGTADPDELVAQAIGLTVPADVQLNWAGIQEKWLKGKTNQFGNQWYYILPNGKCFAWNESRNGGGFLVTTFPAQCYDTLRFHTEREASIVDNQLVSRGHRFHLLLEASDGIFTVLSMWKVN